MEEMDLDEPQKLSDQIDKKFIEKSKRDDEKEATLLKSIAQKKELEKVKEKKRMDEPKPDIDDKAYSVTENEVKLGKGVSMIETKYWDLVEEHIYKVDAKSDGTCRVDAKLTALLSFKDPETS